MIPLSIPLLDGNEWKYVKDCLDTGWISSAGSYVNQFEDMIAKQAGAKYGVACMNGTVGLHIAQIVAGVQANDLVITPNITFIATLNSIKYTGASPVLIDVNDHDWQMNLDLLERFLKEDCTMKSDDSKKSCFHKHSGKKVSAIVPVHVLGNCGDIIRLKEIADKYNLALIEDSTESLGTTHKGQHTGSFGDLGVFSFNGNKILSTGGGGVIVTNNEEFAKKAKHLTTQAKTSQMEYIHDEIGYNYRMVNVLAAIGVAQMEQFPDILAKKKAIDRYYREELDGIGDIQFQGILADTDPNCWLFTFRTSKMRSLLSYLNDNGVQSRPFWMPMNQLEMFKEDIYVQDKNLSNDIYESSISIPSSSGLTKSELKEVVSKIKEFYTKH